MLPDKIEKGHKSLGMRREPVQRRGWPARTDYIGVKIGQLLMWLSKHICGRQEHPKGLLHSSVVATESHVARLALNWLYSQG